MNLSEIANEIFDSQKKAKTIPSFSSRGIEFSLPEAYQIQNFLSEMYLSEGEEISGYKMGLTSKAKQRDVQVFDTISGFLLKSGEIQKNQVLNMASRIHPRVEPEVAVVLKHKLKGPHLTLREVISAIEGIYPALEIVDSRYENFSFKLPDVIADNTSAANFMLGSVNLLPYLEDLNLLGVTVKKNGKIIETGAPASVLGDPLLSIISLGKNLFHEGKEMVPGMVILTGGMTNSVPFQKGDYLEVIWPMETLSFFT